MRPPLLLDEHVPAALADLLRQRGVDVLHVVDTTLRGVPDDVLLAEAARLARVLVSYNVRDFSQLTVTWARQEREHAGVLLVPGQPAVGELARRLLEALDRYASTGLRNTILFV